MNLLKHTLWALGMASLAGCTTVDIEQSINQLNETTRSMTQGQVVLALSHEQQAALVERSETLLDQPLTMNSAIELMLSNSPQFQALLARGW
ncbi:MAG: transporter, partial [Limnobacter sp.]|nr:transporter [Limnobacter sp.]